MGYLNSYLIFTLPQWPPKKSPLYCCKSTLLMEYFNGRTDLVKTLLTDAGIDSEHHSLTDQLTVSHVV